MKIMKTRTLKQNLVIDTISSTVLTASRVFVQVCCTDHKERGRGRALVQIKYVILQKGV